MQTSTNNNPFKSSLSKLSKNQSEHRPQSYAKSTNKFDKNFLNEINEKMQDLKNTDSDLYNKINNENNDKTRIEERVKNIDEYFLDKKRFKLFRKKISETTERTITAGNEYLTKRDKDNIRISESLLEKIEGDEARKYWEYMNRHYISQDIKEKIIGVVDTDSDNYEDVTKYTNYWLNKINEHMYGNNSKNNSDYEEIKSTSDNKLDIEEITNSVKEMPGNYYKKLCERQNEINTECHQKINELRNILTRYKWGQDLLKSENQNQNQNQNQDQTQSQPLEYLVNLDSISNKEGEFYPVTPMPSMRKPPLPTSLPPNKRPQSIAGNTPTDMQNSIETPSPLTTSPSEISQNAPVSDQTSPISAKSEEGSSDQINFLDISTSDIPKLKDQYKNFEDIKKEIISSYNKKLEKARNELLAEFRKEQIKAFSTLSELSKQKHPKNSINKSIQNITNIKSDLYGFNVNTKRFLDVLNQIIPLPPSNKPNLSKNNASEQKSPADTEQPVSEQPNSMQQSSSDPTPQTKDGGESDPKSQSTDEPDSEIDTPENIMDIITGKMYQSDFLEAVADSLLPLYGYMEDENTETNMGQVSKNETDTNSKKGKGLFSRIKGIFSKKEDSDNGGFNKDEMQTLLSSLYSTKDSNIYNLRLLSQYEHMKEDYMKNIMNNPNNEEDADNEPDALEASEYALNYFDNKFKHKTDSDSDKKNRVSGNTIETSLERFQYTRAILRAYICIQCGITNITGNNGATLSENKDKTDLVEEIYIKFFTDLKGTTDDNSIKSTCEKYLKTCNELCQKNNEKNKYENLLKCLEKVKRGDKYSERDLKEALRKNGIDDSPTILTKILTEKDWLISHESSIELNTQYERINKI